MSYDLVKLKDVVEILNNQRKPLNKKERQRMQTGELYPYCGANGVVDYINEYKFNEKILCVAEDGGYWGKNEPSSYLINEPCWVNNHAHVLKETDKVYIEYLYYYLNYTDLTKYITGSTRGKLNRRSLEIIEIILPSKSTQYKIVEAMNLLSNLMEKRQQQIETFSELKRSIFLDMFGDPSTNPKGWDVCTFKDVSTVRQGLQIPIAKRLNKKVENSYTYITVQYLNGKKEAEYILNPKSNVICTKDDILMTRTGNTGMVISNAEGVFHNNFFLIDYNRKLLNKEFLFNYLNTEYIQWDLLRRAGTSTIPDLNHSDFYKIKLYLPPRELQDEFEYKINEINLLHKRLQHGLDKQERLYNSLLHKSFSGELFREENIEV